MLNEEVVGKDNPLAFFHHVEELLSQKVQVVVARAVGASGDCSVESASGPVGALEYSWDAGVFIVAEDSAGFVGQCVQVAEVSSASLCSDEVFPP